jgi:hypothetical protein
MILLYTLLALYTPPVYSTVHPGALENKGFEGSVHAVHTKLILYAIYIKKFFSYVMDDKKITIYSKYRCVQCVQCVHKIISLIISMLSRIFEPFTLTAKKYTLLYTLTPFD